VDVSLAGWDIERFDGVEWADWGSQPGLARAKVLGNADGYMVALIEAEAGYEGDPHVHDFPEFLHVIAGTVENQGQTMTTGDSYAAAAGSTHAQFSTATGATYVLVFRIA
jgi:quercetin dioxygenase-like cupin family protein